MTATPLGSRYQLDTELGRGASGVVWRAVRIADGTPVAVKVLHPEYARDREFVERFVRERRVLLEVDGPHVMRLLDMVVEGDTLALVMPLAATDLRRQLAERGAAPPAEAARVTARVLDGLASLHAAGVVHRDLKPDNVLLDADGQIRLTDFSVSRLSGGGSRLTTAGVVVGTFSYLAPELLDGTPPAGASDVYAAGVLLYELVAGEPPFTGDAVAVMAQAAVKPPRRPAGCPEPLWTVLERMLAKDPARRPRVGEARDGLAGFAGLPTAPPVPPPAVPFTAPAAGSTTISTTGRPRRPGAGRRRWVWAAVAVAVVAAVGVPAYLLNRPSGGGGAAGHPPAPPTSKVTPTEHLKGIKVVPRWAGLWPGASARWHVYGVRGDNSVTSYELPAQYGTNNGKVLTVDAGGLMTAHAKGAALVFISYGPFSYDAAVIVGDKKTACGGLKNTQAQTEEDRDLLRQCGYNPQ
ncbi:MAG: serine/threonine-protein kinase [Mycobacteriales bacterium]